MSDDTQTETVDDSSQNDMVDVADDTAADGGAVDTTDTGADDQLTTGAGDEATPGDQADPSGDAEPPSEAAQRKQTQSPGSQAPTSTQQPTNKTKAPDAGAADPVKKFNDERAHWGRERQKFEQERADYQKRLSAFEQAEQQRKAEAERQQLKAWHPRNPERPRTMERINRVKAYMAALDALPAETRANKEVTSNLARNMRVTPDDAKLFDEFEEHGAQVRQELETDPDGFIATRIEREVPALIQQAFDQFLAHQRATADVDRLMADPDKIKPHADFIRKSLDAGVPVDFVMENVALKNELAAFKAKTGAVGEREQKVERQAKANAERDRLLRGAAKITRDPKVSGKPDFFQLALDESKKHPGNKAWVPGGRLFNRHLVELEEAHQGRADGG